jgi:hypothetical protein
VARPIARPRSELTAPAQARSSSPPRRCRTIAPAPLRPPRATSSAGRARPPSPRESGECHRPPQRPLRNLRLRCATRTRAPGSRRTRHGCAHRPSREEPRAARARAGAMLRLFYSVRCLVRLPRAGVRESSPGLTCLEPMLQRMHMLLPAPPRATTPTQLLIRADAVAIVHVGA